MTEQDLDRAQVCSGLEQVRRPFVAQGVERYMLLDARIASGFFTCVPDNLVRRWVCLVRDGLYCWEKGRCEASSSANTLATSPAEAALGGMSRPPPPLPAPRGSSIAPAVDVAHLEQRYFSPSHARAVKRHQ